MSKLSAIAGRLIVSLVCAIALWTFVSLSQNPTQTLTFDNPVAVENLPQGLVLVDEAGLPLATLPNHAKVVVSAPKEALSGVTQSNIRPYVDLAGFETGTHSVDVQVNTPPLIEITQLQPQQIQVRLEREITATVPLEARTIGQPPFSFEASQPTVSFNGQPIERVVISGPESQVRHVSSARLEIDVANQTADIEARWQPVPINANGQIVTGVRVIPERLDVRVSILSRAGVKRVPVLVRWSGLPAEGYALTRITPEPAFIELVGSAPILESVSSIQTEAVDLSGRDQGFSQQVKLDLPQGVSPFMPSVSSITVTAVIEPLERSFSMQIKLPVELQRLGAGLTASFEPQFLDVTISGDLKALEGLGAEQLKALLDAGGLGPGTYRLTPQLALPPGLTLVRPLGQISLSIQAPPTSTPTPTPVETPTSTTGPSPTLAPSPAPSPEPVETATP